MNDHLELRPVKVKNGLGHHGEPDEEEGIVVEEPERSEEEGPRVMRAPRVPTPKEVEAHETTHIPHEEWCETCMAGRAETGPTSSESPGG